jgi:hypothetical protein
MNTTFDREPGIIENRDEDGKRTRTWNIYGFGKFGDMYELTEPMMEKLFVALGDKIGEIKGGVRYDAEE